jgi:C2 domain
MNTSSSSTAAAGAVQTTPSSSSTTSTTAAALTLRLVRTWNVKVPPAKKKIVGGHLMAPTLALPIAKKRRMVIEIYSVALEQQDVNNVVASSSSPPPAVRGLIRSNASRDNELIDLCAELKDDDWILVRMLKPRRGRWGFFKSGGSSTADDDDDDSSSDSSDSEDDEDDDEEEQTDHKNKKKTAASGGGGGSKNIQDTINATVAAAAAAANMTSPSNLWKQQQDDEWMEYRRYNLEAIADEELSKHVLEATFGLGNRRERREIKFESAEAAQAFFQQLQGLRNLVKERAKDRLEAYKTMRAASKAKLMESLQKLQGKDGGGAPASMARSTIMDSIAQMDEHTTISLLVEIVSAQDLPVTDRASTDPYVTVYLGPQKIHKTKALPNELNPVWTVDTGSLFLMECPAEEFFSYATGLMFRINDLDRVGTNDVIGHVAIHQTDLLQMKGERSSFPIQVEPSLLKKNAKKLYQPKLNLRVRKARPEDKAFIKALHSVRRSKKSGIYADASFVAPNKQSVGLLRRETKKVNGITMVSFVCVFILILIGGRGVLRLLSGSGNLTPAHGRFYFNL